jgi:hypothetical protein
MYIEKQLGIPSQIVSYEMPTNKKNFYRRTINLLKKMKNVNKDKNLSLEKKYLHGQFGGPYSYQHASLSEIISYRMLQKKDLDQCKILVVHRNPVDRLVSVYKYWGFDRKMSFDDFCQTIVLKPQNILEYFGILMHLKTQVSFIDNAGEYSEKVNWISFENLNIDLKNFFNLNNIEIQLDDAKTNKTIKKDIEVTPKALSIIKEVYKEDFVRFGYDI